MPDLLANRILWTAVAANLAAQVLKVILVLLVERHWAPERFLETGGMPSSHSAMVAALAMGVGLQEGFAGPDFAIAAILSAVVMYDATGVRRAAGMHAHMLNELARELDHLFKDGFEPLTLKTLLGHTYPQVLIGAIVGIVAALISFR